MSAGAAEVHLLGRIEDVVDGEELVLGAQAGHNVRNKYKSLTAFVFALLFLLNIEPILGAASSY